MFKFKTAKSKEALKKLPRSLAKHSFLFFIILFLIIAFFGGFIFYYYQYSYSTGINELKAVKPLKFDTEKQQKISEEWQRRSEIFNSTSSQQYSDPFQVD